MHITIIRHLFVAIILAGFVAVISGAAFADGVLSPLPYLASLAHPELALAFIVAKTNLHLAAKSGNTTELKHLIDDGADINEKNLKGETPLHLAVQGQIKTTLALIQAGADIDAKENWGNTPLHLAIEKGQSKIVHALAKAGADIHIKDADGETPLQKATYKGQPKIVFALVKAVTVKIDEASLHKAIKNGDVAKLKQLIDDSQDAFIYAQRQRELKAQRQWEQNEANVKAEIESSITPLHLATKAGQTEVATALIKAGADVNAQQVTIKRRYYGDGIYSPEYNPEDDYDHNEGDYRGDDIEVNNGTPLHFAAGAGHADIALALIEAGADVNSKIDAPLDKGRGVRDADGSTPLHFAAKGGYTDITTALVKAGAHVYAYNKDFKRPLHFAAEEGHTETVIALVEAGADTEEQDRDGNTPLHLAARKSHVDTAAALIKAGANLHSQTEDGKSPLQVATAKYGKESVIVLLLHGVAEKRRNKNKSEAEELLRDLE